MFPLLEMENEDLWYDSLFPVFAVLRFSWILLGNLFEERAGNVRITKGHRWCSFSVSSFSMDGTFILLDLYCMYDRKHLLSLNCKLATTGIITLFIFCTSSNLTKWRAQIYLVDVGSVVIYLEESKEDSVSQFHSASWFMFPIT